MNERRPEKIVSIEKFLPADVLPTTKFLSTLPGIDQDYGNFVGQDTVFWNGQTSIDGTPLTIRITHNSQDTTIQLENESRIEVWELEEKYCDVILFQRRKVVLPGTILNPLNRLTVTNKTLEVALNFCGEKDYSKYPMCEMCPINDPQVGEKKGDYFTFNRPGDLPIRRASGVNQQRTRVVGFGNVQEAIDSMIALRDAIKSATPLLSDQTAPIPSSQSLISEAYFPQD